MEDELKTIKCVCVGDGGVGKTSMLISYCTDAFPEEYVPTVFDNYHAELTLNGEEISLGLWDTAGQEEYDRLRPLSYPFTDVFIICYSVTEPASLENVKTKWLPEMRIHCPKVPFILIGTKGDIRTDKREQARICEKEIFCNFADPKRAKQLGEELGASHVAECSAKTQEGLGHVFKMATQAALDAQVKDTKKRNKCALL